MFTVLTYLVVAVAAFVGGLLVGRRNPAVADAAATAANAAKSAGSAAVDQAKKL